MNLRKMFAILMVCFMAISLFSSCDDSEDKRETEAKVTEINADNSEENEADTESENTEINTADGLKIEILSCAFDKEIMGMDEEISTWGFAERDGKVYVNLALKITNNGTQPLKKDGIKGYFEYDELRYDLQYELMSSFPIRNNDDSLPPECIAYVNMFALVDEAATNENLTVHFSIGENECTKEVDPIDTRTDLEKKIKVSVGDSFNANELYDIDVIECAETKYLRATNYDKSKPYQSYNNKFIDLVLKVKNNTKVNLTGINGYVIIDGEVIRASERVETSDNTELEHLDIKPIKPEEEGLVHIFATVDENTNVEGLKMRFNLAGNCYYCEVR